MRTHTIKTISEQLSKYLIVVPLKIVSTNTIFAVTVIILMFYRTKIIE